MSFIHRRLWALGLPFLLACGSVEITPPSGTSGAGGAAQSSSGTGGSIPATLEAACKNLFAQLAHQEKVCGYPPAETPDDSLQVDTCLALATAPGSLVEPSDFDACAERLGKMQCDQQAWYQCFGYGGDLIFPRHDIRGTRHVGESCVASLQCDSGYCDGSGGCGKCLSVARLGEACPSPEVALCVDSECREGTCQLEGLRMGEACDVDKGDHCQQTLYCKHSPAAGPGHCAPLGTIGDECSGGGQCAPELFCQAQSCGPRLPLGAPCSDAGYVDSGCQDRCIKGTCGTWRYDLAEEEDCTVGACRRDLTCTGGVCKDTRSQYSLPVGAACSAIESSEPYCMPGLICYAPVQWNGPPSTTGVCAVLPKAGEACLNYAYCEPGSLCQGLYPSQDPSEDKPGVCVKQGLEGDPCPCTSDYACTAVGKCARFGPALCN